MAVGDLARVDIISHTFGSNMMNSWGFRSLTNAADWREQLVQEFWDELGPWYLAPLSELFSVLSVECVDIVPGTGATVFGEVTGADSGSAPVAPLPDNVCAVLSYSAGGIGRFQRGRTYVPGLPLFSTNEASMLLQTFKRVQLENFVLNLFEQYGPDAASPWAEFVIISRQENYVVREVPAAFAAVTGRVSPLIATQRRRLHRF